jgi:serine-aspartate repeat-containing protein C/D/E
MNTWLEPIEARLLMTGTLAVTVANDLNANGVRDPGEPGLSGWTVFVDLNTNGSKDAGEPSAVTDSTGLATITNVTAGSTQFDEILPAGWVPAPGFKNFDHVTIHDNRTDTGLFLNVFAGTASGVQGTVWNDIGGDGVRDPGDPGIPGWTVFVDANSNRILDAGELSTITDANGHYAFPDLAPGKYDIREITPAGWNPTLGADGKVTATVTTGSVATADFGNFNAASLGTIRGSVWNDVNADGFRAAGDPGLAGWTVFLDLDGNGALGAGEPSTVTDAGGVYSFPTVTVGNYKVTEVLQSGWNLSPSHPIAVNVTVTNEVPGTADFANFTPTLGSISGKVWNDADGNGFIGVGEAGLPGWTVFIDSDGDGAVSPGEPSAVTDAAGNYVLTGVAVGSNVVREIPASTFSPTAPGTGMQQVNVPNGTAVPQINFGNKQRTDSAIGGTVFADINKNGVRDPGEKGLSGITVFLDTNNNGSPDAGEPSAVTSTDLFYTPATNEAGTYQFTHLPAGTFHVREIVPAILSATPDAVRAQTIDLATGEQRLNANFADVYRPNEIHGVVFDDQNNNHVRDPGEPGIGGVTVYIDSNRNNIADPLEPRTVTGLDGSYSFTTDLGPGSYVVRALHHSGTNHTYPTTTGGILMPGGVSNPTIGNVTPTSITTSLAKNQIEHDTVSLTLPSTGALTSMVDVFLLFDDTGSFTGNSPIVRAAFPQIISTLQAAMPGVDFGFGVGRFEEYANFASEFPTGRPFILNQPIIDQSTPGFATSIQSALDRTAPGFGGDQPETDVEALYQMATGAGFDGNNNGTTTDSGAAGLVSTQLTPGSSGDVPSFGSFTVDPSGNVLPAAGSIGGAGFRPGALPIILTATDTGFAFQPQGETSITGINGLTLPLSAFTQTSRPSTPFNSGAGLQQTVTALNALGALVVGLGTNATATVDPRQGLEAFAKVTGAINRSAVTIPNGTLDPIAPGDPLYFQIASGFGASVANGITTAIQNAVSAVDVNLTVRASDPTVHIEATPGVINHVGAGQTATFDVAFEGDGRPHRFDLQFVREGTNVVLGSIPVVIGTPIVGDGYEYVELEDGEIHNGDDFGDTRDATAPLNVAPSFTEGPNQTVAQDAGAQTVPGWATNISAGPASDAGQLVDFLVSNDNGGLFSAAPTIAEDGTLSYTPAPGASGTATVTVRAHDTGGTIGGGQDTSDPQTFTITVNPVTSPLTITSSFDFQTAQALLIDFSQNVQDSLTVSDLQIVNLDTAAPVSVGTLSYDAVARRATVTFSPAVLPDGNYRLTIAAGSMPNQVAPHQLDFFVLAGDANHDRVVDLTDFTVLASNFNQSGKTFGGGNFSYDAAGNVDLTDFTILAANFNKTLAPPTATTTAVATRFAPAAAAPTSSVFSGSRITSNNLVSDVLGTGPA